MIVSQFPSLRRRKRDERMMNRAFVLAILFVILVGEIK